MFTGVCLSTGGVPGLGGAWSGGLPGLVGGACLEEGVCSGGGGWSGGVPAPRGVSGRGVCLVETPRTPTPEGGTHSTGMHSCLSNKYSSYFQKIQNHNKVSL